MTTEEFIEAVNAIDDVVEIKATVNGHGDILLRVFDEDEDVPLETAILKRHAINWGILATSLVVIPTRILKLMVEMAESRKDDNKYVLLNGNPFLFEGELTIRVFSFSANSLSSSMVRVDDLANFAYTKEELEQLKSTLPKELQDAADMLTVTIGEAKKVLKNDY